MAPGDKPLVWIGKMTMDNTKKNRLMRKGWKVGNTAEFLELSPQESEYIELKLTLSQNLKKQRQHNKLTQDELGKLLRSSQSRVAKMEAGDPTVTLDLLIRSLLALGVSKKNLAKMIEQQPAMRAA